MADLFTNPDLCEEDLYPLVASLTPSQMAVASLNGFSTLIKMAGSTEEDLQGAKQKVDQQEKETFSLYLGVDRDMFEGGIALTSDAKRKDASTGDKSWSFGGGYMSFQNEWIMKGLIIGTAVASFVAACVTIYLGIGAYETVSYVAASEVAMTWAGEVAAAYVLAACLAAFAILVITYIVMEIISYYNPSYTEIPLVLMDLKQGESDEEGDWEKYVKYSVVREEDGDSADLNQFEGKQWNAMYTTKDRAAGNPLLADSFRVQYGNSTTPRGCDPVHYFGTKDAFDLNSHCFNNDVDGIFLFFQRDAKAFASTSASMFADGRLAVITGLGGLLLGVLGTALVTGKRKITPAQPA